MNVSLSILAKQDLVAIGTGVSDYSERAAAKLVNDILYACERLSHMPERHSQVPRQEGTGVRRVVFKRYLIFYVVGADKVEVLRILPGARDYGHILFPNDDLA